MLVEKLEDQWIWKGWQSISSNEGLPWTIDLIEKFENKWDWHSLSINKALPWTVELVEKFEDKWVWPSLSINKALPWSSELIEKFENKKRADSYDETNQIELNH